MNILKSSRASRNTSECTMVPVGISLAYLHSSKSVYGLVRFSEYMW